MKSCGNLQSLLSHSTHFNHSSEFFSRFCSLYRNNFIMKTLSNKITALVYWITVKYMYKTIATTSVAKTSLEFLCHTSYEDWKELGYEAEREGARGWANFGSRMSMLFQIFKFKHISFRLNEAYIMVAGTSEQLFLPRYRSFSS